MSHWVNIQSKIGNLDMLKKALNRMGLSYIEGNFTIERNGQSSSTQLKIDNAVGFGCQKDGTYALVGDPYYSTQMRKYYSHSDKLQADLNTAYSIEESKLRLEEQMFYCTENEEAQVGENGLIQMVYERH